MQFTKDNDDYFFTKNKACQFLVIPDRYLKVCEYIWKNKRELVKKQEDGFIAFDYPDYGGMGKALYNDLRGDLVDFIQDLISGSYCDRLTDMTKKQFMRNMIGRYLCDL
jgi:hypothetical protein